MANPLAALFNPEISKLYRHLFAEMIETDVDGQGRVQLTPELRAYAGIDKDIVVAGVGDWIEIWSTENWQAYKDENLTPEKLIEAAKRTLEEQEGGEAGESVPSAGSA